MTNVVTGHRLSFGTSSDVLAQQFALMVGWIGMGLIESFPRVEILVD